MPIEQKVVLMESDSNYTIIYLNNGQKILSGYNLKFFENITDSQSFMRLNRSEIINKIFVKFINLNDSSLTLNNGRTVYISRRRIKAFQAWI